MFILSLGDGCLLHSWMRHCYYFTIEILEHLHKDHQTEKGLGCSSKNAHPLRGLQQFFLSV